MGRGLQEEDLSDTYYMAMLRFLGCSVLPMSSRQWSVATT